MWEAFLARQDSSASATQDGQALQTAVQFIVDQQRAVGLDIINEGELTKGGDWLSFADKRLGGFEERPFPASGSMLLRGRDRQEFAQFYQYATERQTLFFTADDRIKLTRRYTVATSPITYTGMPELAREIELLRSAVGDTRHCFLTSTAPSSLEVYRGNEYYTSADEYVFALAEALRVEYEAIVARRLSASDRRCLDGCAVGSDRYRDGTGGVQEVLHGSRRGTQPCAAQHL